eukprot:g64187.t1
MLGLWLFAFHPAHAMDPQHQLHMASKVKEMFYHGWENYLTYAFPHDELKPLSCTWTDSMAEMGGSNVRPGRDWRGLALTVVDSLSTLATLGNSSEFAKQVSYLCEHLDFNVDVRVNVFEANIRLLGGLLSAHLIAADSTLGVWPCTDSGVAAYDGCLLAHARSLGLKLLPAFEKDESVIPYAWVNLKYGVRPGETQDTCTAGVGTLLLEFGTLSFLTDDMIFFEKADAALMALWGMRSKLGLIGNSFDRRAKQWKNPNAGIGAGIDSFYEYLLKAYVLFGNRKYLDMFMEGYAAANKYLRIEDWYVEADMHTGKLTHMIFNSLQAFWPGLQVMAGDIGAAELTFRRFASLWLKYRSLPERFFLNSMQLGSEKYYPLRPELMESTYLLRLATGDPFYLQMGELMVDSFNAISRVPGGYAAIKHVGTQELDDIQTSFFLSEVCKYLFLLFSDHHWLHSPDRTYVFTTEAHPLPVTAAMHERFGDGSEYGTGVVGEELELPPAKCPPVALRRGQTIFEHWKAESKLRQLEMKVRSQEGQCAAQHSKPNTQVQGEKVASVKAGDFSIQVAQGTFRVEHVNKDVVEIRNLGSNFVELTNAIHEPQRLLSTVLTESHVFAWKLGLKGCGSHDGIYDVSGGTFNPSPFPHVLDPLVEEQLPPDPDPVQPAAQGETSSGSAAQAAAPVPLEFRSMVQAPLVRASPVHACVPHTNLTLYKDKIVLAARGECTFTDKLVVLQSQGALGMVVDNVQDDNNFFLMGEDGSNREVWIPAVMLPHRLTISTVLPCLEQAPDQAEAVLWELQRSLVDLQLEQPERGQPEQPVSPSNDPSSSAHSSSDNPQLPPLIPQRRSNHRRHVKKLRTPQQRHPQNPRGQLTALIRCTILLLCRPTRTHYLPVHKSGSWGTYKSS